jgi:hypothetical protein
LLSTNTHACEFMASKTLWHTKTLWHAMTNIGAINSKHIKTCGVTKSHALSWKFVIPCCQMACHVIITCKIKSLSIAKNNNIFNYLINEINSSNQWHESWCWWIVTSSCWYITCHVTIMGDWAITNHKGGWFLQLTNKQFF